VCWEVTLLWKVPSEAAFIPAAPVHHLCSNCSSPNIFVLCSSDVVTCKAGAKSCTWPGTTIMAQSRGQALETHLERQSCFQPHPPSRAAVLHRSGPGASISQQSWVLNNSGILLLEGNSAVQDEKGPQRTHSGPHGWIVSRPRLLSSPGTIAAGSWVSHRDKKIGCLLSIPYWNG